VVSRDPLLIDHVISMRSANFTNKMAYANYFCYLLGHTINLEAPNLVGCTYEILQKNNILGSKGGMVRITWPTF